MNIKGTRSILFTTSVLFFIIGITAVLAFSVISNQVTMQAECSAAAKAHNLAIALFAYSNDNGQAYPSGPTSTAVFNQLYSAGYLHDPADVYLPGTGKVLYTGGLPIKLTSQNVSYSIVERSDGGALRGISGTDDTDLPLILSCDIALNTFANRLSFAPSKSSKGVVLVTVGQQASFVPSGYSLPENFTLHGHTYVIVGP